jgi:4,5-DOPA dioxygenase extradiol
MSRHPSLFVSHGSPMLAIEDSPAHRFLKEYGRELGRPAAILVVSAHWETERPTVATSARPGTVHDFSGFPPALYELTYPAPGAPELAGHAAALLEAAGFPADVDDTRGLDHGAWVPLLLMYPEADVPVTQLSLQTHLGPAHHFRIGEALRPLREAGVLVLGSGSLTHNLGEFRQHRGDRAPPPWVVEFADWIADKIACGSIDDLLDYRRRTPHAERNHPTDEHLLPLFFALGAAGPGAYGARVHTSNAYGVLAMDAYAFDELARQAG